MPGKKRASIKNEKQYEALKKKGMSKERAARISNASESPKRGGEESHLSRRRSTRASQGGTTAQRKAAGRKRGKSPARKRSS